MKRFPIILAALATLVSCGGPKQESPLKTAIVGEIREQLGDEGAAVSFNTVELVDSSSFAQEFDRRRATLELRLSQNEKLYKKYLDAFQTSKAKEKEALVKKDKEHLAALAELEASLKDTLSCIAFYDYKFSGSAKKSDGSKVLIKDTYIAITPEFEVLALSNEQKSLRKSTGKVIPGYSAIFE